MTLSDLRDDGPPVRVAIVAALAGVSKDKVYDDADRGDVRIRHQRCGQRWRGLIERAEALRYLAALDT